MPIHQYLQPTAESFSDTPVNNRLRNGCVSPLGDGEKTMFYKGFSFRDTLVATVALYPQLTLGGLPACSSGSSIPYRRAGMTGSFF